MPLVAPAARTVVLRTRVDQPVVGLGAHPCFDRFPEAWPAGAAVVLGLRFKERQEAGGADKGPGPLLFIQRAGEGRLVLLLKEHPVAARLQDLAPFGERLLQPLELGSGVCGPVFLFGTRTRGAEPGRHSQPQRLEEGPPVHQPHTSKTFASPRRLQA